jgi:hypothetical protein
MKLEVCDNADIIGTPVFASKREQDAAIADFQEAIHQEHLAMLRRLAIPPHVVAQIKAAKTESSARLMCQAHGIWC